MLLNNLTQNFAIYFTCNTFYPEVVDMWKPVMKRMFLPYLDIESLMNSQITSISFPSVQHNPVQQGYQNYKLTKRGGRQLNQEMTKTFTLTFKLTESYLTYFIARQQFDLFLKLGEQAQDLYMPPISITILDDGGFEIITYTYSEITPTNLSDFDLSFAARPGTFNTFTWEFSYNYFDIWYRDPSNKRIKLETDPLDGVLIDKGPLNLSALPANYNYISSIKPGQSIQQDIITELHY